MRQEPGDLRGAVRQRGELPRRTVSAGDGPADALSGRIVARAREAIGAPFRLHGRSPGEGLDCVGLAAWALGADRIVPSGYRLRGGDPQRIAAIIDNLGLAAVAAGRAGDVVLARSGPGQLHLAILTEAGFVHADAMLRRVVERPGAVPWPIIGCWRFRVSELTVRHRPAPPPGHP